MSNFCSTYHFKKNLTDRQTSPLASRVVEIELSVVHEMLSIDFKMSNKKVEPRIII